MTKEDNIISSEEGLHSSCHGGGNCCTNPCGPVYMRREPQLAEIVATEEELSPEDVKLRRLRSLTRKVMAPLS